jgi:hypothetical protein
MEKTMILDKETLISNDQAVTASAASTDYIDFGAQGTVAGPAGGNPPTPHYKAGRRGRLVARVSEADFATLDSLQVSVEVDDNTGFSSARTVLAGEDIALSSLVKGAVLLDVQIPQTVNERYLRLYYTVTGSNATAGKVTAGIIWDEQVN